MVGAVFACFASRVDAIFHTRFIHCRCICSQDGLGHLSGCELEVAVHPRIDVGTDDSHELFGFAISAVGRNGRYPIFSPYLDCCFIVLVAPRKIGYR